MKKITIHAISIYQKLISPALKQLLGIKAFCRYSTSCSEYTKNAIETKGIIKGGLMAVKRILSCNPLNKNYEYI